MEVPEEAEEGLGEAENSSSIEGAEDPYEQDLDWWEKPYITSTGSSWTSCSVSDQRRKDAGSRQRVASA